MEGEMIRAVVADDEKIIREGIAEWVDWNKLGICLVGCAKNGEALVLPAVVQTRELLGAEAVYTFESEAGKIQMKNYSDYLPEPGEKVNLIIERKHLFFFDDSGKAFGMNCGKREG